jgi:putative effector of murein hydrolase LrgA (UPF0299 family)
MLEAHRRRRPDRANQRGALAPLRRNHGPVTAARRDFVAKLSSLAGVSAKALHFLELITLNPIGYQVAVWLDLPLPGKVALLLVLVGELSRRVAPRRLLEKAMVLLGRPMPLLLVSVSVGVVSFRRPGWRVGMRVLASLGGAIYGDLRARPAEPVARVERSETRGLGRVSFRGCATLIPGYGAATGRTRADYPH